MNNNEDYKFLSRLLSKTNLTQIAICTDSTSITYESLSNSIDILASKLLSAGAKAGDMIAVCVNCPIDFIISSLSTFKLGCNIIPLDPCEPQLKNKNILDKCLAELIITDSEENFSFFNGKILNSKILPGEKPDMIEISTAQSFGIALFRPYFSSEWEGIILSSNIFENWITFNKETLNIPFERSVFTYRNLKDMFSFIWLPVLYDGGTLYLGRDKLPKNTNDFETIIMPLNLLPDIYSQVAEEPSFTNFMTFGEALYDTSEIKSHFKKSGIKWYNYFGFPFIQMVSTITGTLQEEGGIKYLQHEGKPIKNTATYILDEALAPQPMGVPGELYISTPVKYNLVNNEALQNDVILPDMYNEGNSLFKAGYRAKLLPNGRFQVLEHSDGSFFVNGSYGKLNDVTRALLSVSIIKESAVLNNKGEIFIYYIPYENVSINDINNCLKQHLSYIYFPMHLVPSSQIPKDSNGKPDTNLLMENRTLSSIECRSLETELMQIPLDDCAVIPMQILNDPVSLQSTVDIYCIFDIKENTVKNKILQVTNKFLSQTVFNDLSLSVNYYYMDKLPRKSSQISDIDLEALQKINRIPMFLNERNQNPLSDLESALLDIWSNLLNKPSLKTTDNFFRNGGTSLILTKMIFQIKERLEISVPFRAILYAPTVQKLALYINGDIKDEVIAIKKPDFTEDVILDSSIRALASYAKSPSKELNSLLLTGSTGFIGAYLLGYLLKFTQSKIYCLVRSETESDVKARIVENLRQYNLLHSLDETRIIPVLGDLSLPKLGIAPEHYKDLSERIDAIYHNGALVNFSYPYDALKPSNVDGTKEVLRFAATKRLKHVHHVSTLAVYSALTGGEIINEEYPTDLSTNLKTGYSQSKLVADCIVQSARELGIPSTIYRVCTAIGDSVTGSCQTKDLFWILLKACISLKMFPDIDLPFNLIPVDRLAESIVRLSLEEPANGQNNYHLDNHEAVPIPQIAAWLQEYGYPVELISYDYWYLTLSDYINSSEDASLALLLGSLPQSKTFFDKVKHVAFNSEKTALKLAKTGVPVTTLNQKEFFNNISYFIGIGFLPKI